MAKIKNDRKLTLGRLKEVLHSDQETGLFLWKVTASPKAVVGSIAGTLVKSGYRMIVVDGEHHRASRLAWFYVYGEWPERLVDHENRIKSDDRLANLRLASFAQNLWNTGPTKRSPSGLKGAYRSSHGGWQSSIMCEGKRLHLGSFNSAAEAAAAYEDAANKLRGEFARIA